MKQAFLWLTERGGSHELYFAAAIVFIFGRRSRFMYYLAIYGIDKFFVDYPKLVLADPRPYMIEQDIKPLHCSDSFGKPSGHSTAAAISFAIFLDTFHGKDTKVSVRPVFYYLALVFTIFWYISIPYSRFLMGVHSLDQILFGVM